MNTTTKQPVGLTIERAPLWATVNLPGPHRCLSWAVAGGGWRQATHVIWREVSDRDLTRDADPAAYLREQLAARGHADAVGLMTSRDLTSLVHETAVHGGKTAECVASVGLSNGVRIGELESLAPLWGTINILCRTSFPLNLATALEALSLVAEARTAAVLDGLGAAGDRGPLATGTGTDCIVIASPVSLDPDTHYCGTHTNEGHLVGKSTYNAVRRGVDRWVASRLARELRSR